MNRINLGKNIIRHRLDAGMTQDQLAEFIGVSKSAVSKWENGMTYPDILLLPQLATLFNVTVDDLLGYEPQMTKEAIIKLYRELMADVAAGKAQKALDKSREYIKKYYSCFPLLQQMAVFYLNHNGSFEEGQQVLEEAKELCQRIRHESQEAELVNDAATVEAIIQLGLGKAEAVLEILGDEAKVVRQDSEIIAAAYQHRGDLLKAKEITQVNIYQHLLFAIGDSTNYLVVEPENLALAEMTIERLGCVIDAYQVDYLHPKTSLSFYFAAAMVYAKHAMKEETLAMLLKYVRPCKNLCMDMQIHGDDYFDLIGPWISKLDLGSLMPMTQDEVKQSVLKGVTDHPAFEFLHNDANYRSVVNELKKLIRL